MSRPYRYVPWDKGSKHYKRVGLGGTPMQLVVHDEFRDDAAVVRVEGEIDAAVKDEFSSHLRVGMNTASTDPVRPLIIDLQDVAFFGCTGLNAVLGCLNDGRANGIAVRLVATNPMVVRVIEVTKLDKALVLYPSLDEALQVRDPETL
jgi:anti-anti-sigma factor